MKPELKQHIKAIIGHTPVKYFKYGRARVLEQLGVDRFSYPALYGMDRRLIEYFSKRDGFFIEAGANDGFAQSNTYALERLHGWRGILIEPVPQLYTILEQFRPSCALYNCALGPAEDGNYAVKREIAMEAEDLKSSIAASDGGGEARRITVPQRTLSSIIDEHGSPDIDLFSLDVEGFECEVLGGLDLRRHRPACILVETVRFAEVGRQLAAHYRLAKQLSHHDYLFERL